MKPRSHFLFDRENFFTRFYTIRYSVSTLMLCCLGIFSQAQSVVSFQSLQYPGLYIRHSYYKAFIQPVKSALDEKDASFKIVQGLSADCADCISLESVNIPGQFLRHQNYRIVLGRITSDLDRKDASFRKRTNSTSSAVAFESFNFPKHYIRPKNNELFITQVADYARDNEVFFVQNSSFNEAPPRTGSVTFVNPTPHLLDVFLKDLQGNNDVPKGKIGGMGATMTLVCTVGQVYEFKQLVVDRMGYNELQLTIKDEHIGGTVNLSPPQRLWSNLPTGPDIDKPAGNLRANRHSYDLLYLDPIFIDYDQGQDIMYNNVSRGKGGMRKQIFKEIQGSDNNWHASNRVPIENHFDFKYLYEGSFTTNTEIGYSAESFMRSFSGNIGFSAGVEGVAKGKNSAAFNYADGQSKNKRNVFIYSKSVAGKYQVTFNGKDVNFTAEFKKAVNDLPSNSIPTDLAAARRDPSFQQYKNFIQTWGTHYPVNATYGGMHVFMSSASEEKLTNSNNWGLNVKNEMEATVKRVTLGGQQEFDYKQETKNEQGFDKSNTYSFYKGGNGAPDKWEASNADVQPIGVTLARLHELFVAKFFPNVNGLAGKQAMLKYAIEDYLGSAKDDGKSFKAVKYKISDIQLKNVGNLEVWLYGNIHIADLQKLQNNFALLPNAIIWSRGSSKSESVVLKPGQVISIDPPTTFTFDAVHFPHDERSHLLVLIGKLLNWRWNSSPEFGFRALEINALGDGSVLEIMRGTEKSRDTIDQFKKFTVPFYKEGEGSFELTFRLEKVSHFDF